MHFKYKQTLELVHEQNEAEGPDADQALIEEYGSDVAPEEVTEDIDPDALKEKKQLIRMKLRELFQSTKNDSTMTETGLKPISDRKLSNLEIKDSQVKAFQFLYNSLAEYKQKVSKAK